MKKKYSFDRNDYGDLYIRKDIDPDSSVMDINRVIVNKDNLDEFLKDFVGFLQDQFGINLVEDNSRPYIDLKP